jgi:hypothetical protein
MEWVRAVYIHPDLRDQRLGADAAHRVFFEEHGHREASPSDAGAPKHPP